MLRRFGHTCHVIWNHHIWATQMQQFQLARKSDDDKLTCRMTCMYSSEAELDSLMVEQDCDISETRCTAIVEYCWPYPKNNYQRVGRILLLLSFVSLCSSPFCCQFDRNGNIAHRTTVYFAKHAHAIFVFVFCLFVVILWFVTGCIRLINQLVNFPQDLPHWRWSNKITAPVSAAKKNVGQIHSRQTIPPQQNAKYVHNTWGILFIKTLIDEKSA